MAADRALARLLDGTGLKAERSTSGAMPTAPRCWKIRRRWTPGWASPRDTEIFDGSIPEENDMTARTIPPFRADHVGSFLRPAYLLEARDQFFNQKSSCAGQPPVRSARSISIQTDAWP